MNIRLAALLLASCTAPVKSGESPPEAPGAAAGLRVSVRLAPSVADSAQTGRLLLLLSARGDEEPRNLVSDHDDTAQVFGIDVEGWKPGESRVVDGGRAVAGYPIANLADVPPGDYMVQALLHKYETFRRADGHVVSLPPDRGEGQQWNEAPGNLVSTPRRIRVDAAAGGSLDVVLDRALPPLPAPQELRRVRRVKLRSELLSKFWGRDTFLGAMVLLPEGWESHPRARYPLAIYHGHFSRNLTGYREAPPDPKLPQPDLENLRRHCPNGHGDQCAKYGY